jgi:hypothetical protein
MPYSKANLMLDTLYNHKNCSYHIFKPQSALNFHKKISNFNFPHSQSLPKTLRKCDQFKLILKSNLDYLSTFMLSHSYSI